MATVKPICPECGQELISPKGCKDCARVLKRLRDIHKRLDDLAKKLEYID